MDCREEDPVQRDLDPLEPTADQGGKDQACGGGESQSEGESGFQLAVQDGILQLDTQDVDALSSLNKELSMMLDVTNTLRTPPPRIDLSPFECHTLQKDELEVLTSIYGEDMTTLNDEGTCFVIDIKFLSGEIKEDDVIKVWFSLPANYPSVPPILEIEANQSGSFTYRDADNLFDLLMEESLKRVGEMMVFDLVTIAQEHMAVLVEAKRNQTQQKEEEVRKEHLESAELSERESVAAFPDHLLGDFAPTASEGASMVGVPDFDAHVHYRPFHFVGPISAIVKKLPQGMQLSRLENIMRQDLAARFQRTMKEISRTLWHKSRANPLMYDISPQIAFHGTRTKSLPSIVHHGLVIPGQQNKVEVRCGSSLGVGIYLSPDPDFSFHYSDSSRLVVCAAVLGRVYKGRHASFDGARGFSSVISSSGSEWVIFNAAQVLPCYVIEVMDVGTNLHNPVPPPLSGLTGGQEQGEESGGAKKARLEARARKFLPYGYGPGKKTVIEDAASFDDDEEDYGDYQLLRYAEMEDSGAQAATMVKTELQDYRFTDAF